jgi:hypothetical protein
MLCKFSSTLNMETEGTYLDNDTTSQLKLESFSVRSQNSEKRLSASSYLSVSLCACPFVCTEKLGPSPDEFS